ncbi:hypothetical protein [Catenovulum sediminis]|uniref:Uncharacterized protein n=1 Tax=Catenovulum sediminis TaxID=1740262 RepID=A0ABV1RKC4_9ALTE|nr:hypothetical protein [Catenovulum sediminis]
MKELARKIFAPVLRPFEAGAEPYHYKPLNRTILLVVGFLFLVLATTVYFLSPPGYGFLIPFTVFGAGGCLCLIIGLLGADRAVAKIWGNK